LRGEDSVSAPSLAAEVWFGHVSVHPFRVWKTWFKYAGMPVVEKVRGPMFFFDRQRWLCGLIIAMDPVLDCLPGKFLTATNLGILCRKRTGK
jgi:hypothetical protein